MVPRLPTPITPPSWPAPETTYEDSMTEDAAEPAIVTAALVVIGDEILSGRTKDKNIGTVADHLTSIGIRLKEVHIVPDEENEIIAAVNALRARYDYVFTTGGIGPTHDDITADAVAKAFGVGIDVDERAVALLLERIPRADLTEARLRMARIPFGADLVENSVSKAPGFFIGNVIVMAGVPRIMEAMLAAVTPRLRTGAKLLSLTVDARTKEGDVAPVLTATQKVFPDVPMGSYPYENSGKFGALIVLRSTRSDRLEEAAAAFCTALGEAGIPWADVSEAAGPADAGRR
jgi:molybdenum cofactor synthesis domain-containing protein